MRLSQVFKASRLFLIPRFNYFLTYRNTSSSCLACLPYIFDYIQLVSSNRLFLADMDQTSTIEKLSVSDVRVNCFLRYHCFLGTAESKSSWTRNDDGIYLYSTSSSFSLNQASNLDCCFGRNSIPACISSNSSDNNPPGRCPEQRGASSLVWIGYADWFLRRIGSYVPASKHR